MSRRAVITGIGVITPLGHDLASFRAGLLAGTPGVRRTTAYDASRLPCPLFAELEPAFDPKKFIPATNKEGRKGLSKMAKTIQMGLCASQLCMDDAALKKGDVPPARFGIEFGCVMVATDIADLAKAGQVSVGGEQVNLEKWGRLGQPEIIPVWLLKFLPNMPACHTSIFFDAQGPNNTITVEDAAGLLALGEAYRLLVRDSADFFLVGGCESKLNPVSNSRLNAFTTFTKRHDAPGSAVRPFDTNRDGTVLGEAATTFALEELDRAKARGAKIYAEVVGFASGFDRGLTGKVLATVIRNALKEANITPADVDHVNAHAAGYDYDAFEAKAILEVFGKSTPVIALKGQIGHSGAASCLGRPIHGSIGSHIGTSTSQSRWLLANDGDEWASWRRLWPAGRFDISDAPAVALAIAHFPLAAAGVIAAAAVCLVSPVAAPAPPLRHRQRAVQQRRRVQLQPRQSPRRKRGVAGFGLLAQR